MLANEIFLALLFIGLLTGIVSGIPVSFILLGLPLLIAVLANLFGVFDLSLMSAFPVRAFGVVTNPILVSVPLFVLMGSILEKSQIAERMMVAAGSLFGSLRGGLAYAVIIVGMLLAASTGVIGATIFMLGMIALPAMLKVGYSKHLSAGVICASGTLGQIIPPSILLILLADQVSSAYLSGRRAAGDWSPDPVSVGDLFAGALFPGLILTGLYLLYVLLISVIRPSDCPPVNRNALSDMTASEGRSNESALSALLVPLLLIVLVLGSILSGIATPTESAAIGAAGALLMSAYSRAKRSNRKGHIYLVAGISATSLIVLRILGTDGLLSLPLSYLAASGVTVGLIAALVTELRHNEFGLVLKETAAMISMMLLIVLGANMLSLVFVGLGGEKVVHHFLTDFVSSPLQGLVILLACIFVLGFVLEYIEIIFIVVPIAGPPLMQAGIDPVWFAILISVVLQTSFLTPPFGYALFYLKAVSRDQLTSAQIFRSIIPFVAIQLVTVALIFTFPKIATILPGLLYD